MTSTISKTLRVLALFVAMMLAMTCLDLFGAAAAADAAVLTLEEIEEIGRLEMPATKAYEDIMYSWMNHDGKIEYPDSFGGCYLTDDYKLAVRLVDSCEELRSEVLDIVIDPNVVRFETTDISLSELFEIQRNIYNIANDVNIYETSIDQSTSTVIVGVEKLPQAQPYRTLSVAEQELYAHITFEEIERPELTASCKPGEMFSGTLSGIGGTLGWYGTYTFNGITRNCILMSGHVALAYDIMNEGIKVGNTVVVSASYIGNSNYYLNSVSMGDTVSGVGDYAIVTYSTTTDGLTPTIYVPRTVLSGSQYEIVDETMGDTVIRYCETTLSALRGKLVYKPTGRSGYRTGTVVSTNTFYWPDFKINNQTYEAFYDQVCKVQPDAGTIFCDEGDSGGPVYYANGLGNYSLCGIISGKRSEGANYYGYFTPMSLICAAGFEPYLG